MAKNMKISDDFSSNFEEEKIIEYKSLSDRLTLKGQIMKI